MDDARPSWSEPGEIPDPGPTEPAVLTEERRDVPESLGDCGPASQQPWFRVSLRSAGMRLSVLGATLLFAAFSLGFVINTPTLIGPDELYHFDRVQAASHGDLLPDPGQLFVSLGTRNIENTLIATQMRRGSASWAQYAPPVRSTRPSLNQLGGNTRSSTQDVSNYQTQHPPLYYAVMGSVMWLLPQADDMPADTLVFWLRFIGMFMVAPLPLLFGRAAMSLFGRGPITAAAPYLPLLIPGLARGAATLNNDNLAILIGAAVVTLAVQVLRGDRSWRTAVWLAGLCVAGSLTKGTVLVVLGIVPVAYAIQWIRLRSLPERKVLLILGGGAVLSAVWWVRNLLVYHQLVPAMLAWGSQYGLATGAPRPANQPFDPGLFWNTAFRSISRFWAALGLHEPPKLPNSMVYALWIALFVCFAVSILTLRRRRIDVVVLWAVPAASLALIIQNSFVHNESYLAIAGIQGRYAYPALFGMLIPFAVVGAFILGRARRWNPVLLLMLGLLVSGWALYISVEYTWLVRGTKLVPTNWYTAFRNLAGWSAFPGPATASLVALVLVAAAAGVVCAGLSVLRSRPAGTLQDLLPAPLNA